MELRDFYGGGGSSYTLEKLKIHMNGGVLSTGGRSSNSGGEV